MPFRILLLFFGFILLSAASVSAAAFRTASHEGYQRLVFDMGRPFSYKVSTDGKIVSITFPFELGVSEKTMRSRLPKPLNKCTVQITPDGTTCTFPLLEPRAYKIMTFDNKFVLDLFTDLKDMPLDSSVKTKVAAVGVAELKQITRVRTQQPVLFKDAPLVMPDVSFDFKFDALPALALFERAGVWWIVFDSPLKEEIQLAHDLILSSAYTSEGNVTIYTVLLHPKHQLMSTRLSGGNGWRISVVQSSPSPTWTIPVFPILSMKNKKPFIFLADSVISDPIKVDRVQPFYVLPTRQERAGLPEELHFVDMDFLKTQQGVVIEPNSRDFAFAATPYGVDVESLSSKKMTLSTEDPMMTYGVLGSLLTDDTEESLISRIEEKKETAGMDRLRLSALYIRKGDFLKSNDTLNKLFYSQDALAQSGFFRMLKGMTRFGLGNSEEAIAYFIHPIVKDAPESLLWQGIIENKKELYDRYNWYLRFYPESLLNMIEERRKK